VPTLPRTDQMRAPTNKLPESNTAYDSVDSYSILLFFQFFFYKNVNICLLIAGTYQNLILSPIDDDK